ncbi:MAG TPA: GNAT family protein [Polyangiaceae bacterium]|nr:GNAT family protein [Polyangiaceae bacterium]
MKAASVLDESPSVSLSLRLEGDRIALRAPKATDITELRSVLLRNGDHLRPWSPSPPPGTNPAGIAELGRSIGRHRNDWKAGTGYVFVVTLKPAREKRVSAWSVSPAECIAGRVALTSVTRGPFQSAQLGYWIDVDRQGVGLMSEAVDLVLAFAFEELRLHRIHAAVMPSNGASRRLLAKRRFREEGFAARYLRIAGKWEDHVIYGLTAEDWTAAAVAPRTRPRAAKELG